MNMVRFVIRSSMEAYRQILGSQYSFPVQLVWTIITYVIISMTVIHLRSLDRISIDLESTDVFALAERDVAGVVKIGEQIRGIHGVRGVEFVFPGTVVPVHETHGDPSSSPYIFFHLRSSVDEDTLNSVLEKTRRITGVLDVLYSERQTMSLRNFQESLQSGYSPLFTVLIGLYVLIVIFLSWMDVVRYTPTIKIMRSLGASRLYTSMPCAIIGGIRGVIGMAISIPVIEIVLRCGFFDIHRIGKSDGSGVSMELVAISGILAPVLCSLLIAWIRASFDSSRS